MKVIHKFALMAGVGDEQIYLPRGAELLHLEVQNNTVCLWAIVDTNEPMMPVTVRTVGTGQQMLDAELMAEDYVGTYQLGKQFVGHVFIT